MEEAEFSDAGSDAVTHHTTRTTHTQKIHSRFDLHKIAGSERRIAASRLPVHKRRTPNKFGGLGVVVRCACARIMGSWRASVSQCFG